MNPDDDSFENLLRTQPIRQIPSDWRQSILPKEQKAWPGPNAWRALAACWVIIVGLQLLTHSKTPPTSQLAKALPRSQAEFQQSTYQLALAIIQPKNTSR